MQEEHIAYLENVLKTWVKFCEHHPCFEQAIMKVLLENSRLKKENEQLKRRLNKWVQKIFSYN